MKQLLQRLPAYFVHDLFDDYTQENHSVSLEWPPTFSADKYYKMKIIKNCVPIKISMEFKSFKGLANNATEFINKTQQLNPEVT